MTIDDYRKEEHYRKEEQAAYNEIQALVRKNENRFMQSLRMNNYEANKEANTFIAFAMALEKTLEIHSQIIREKQW
jgi:hypothetical protein